MNQLVLRSYLSDIRSTLGIHYCSQGCGQYALFYAPTTKRYRCSRSVLSCPVSRKRNGENHSGSKCWCFGKHLSKEIREKISNFHKGKLKSEETKRKLSIAHKGKKLPKSECIARSIRVSGSKNPFYGKHHTKKIRERLSEATSNYFSAPSKIYGRVKRVKVRNILGREYFVQGTWEVKMAEFLNSKGIIWERSSKIPYILDGIKHHYLPDFYLPLYDKYIEVKGYYPEKAKTKMKLVLEQNDINLSMAFEKDMSNLDGFISRVIDYYDIAAY